MEGICICGHERKWHWEATDKSLTCVQSSLESARCKCNNYVEQTKDEGISIAEQ